MYNPDRKFPALPSAPVLGAILVAMAACIPGAAAAQQADTIEQRAAKLVSQMTLEEKASLLINTNPAIPRLHIPDYQWWSEALHGYAFQPHATNFPEPIGLAASFDAPLIKQSPQRSPLKGFRPAMLWSLPEKRSNWARGGLTGRPI